MNDWPTVKLAEAEPEQKAIFIPQICTVFVQSLCINTLPAAMGHGGLDPFTELSLLFLTITTHETTSTNPSLRNAAFLLNKAHFAVSLMTRT